MVLIQLGTALALRPQRRPCGLAFILTLEPGGSCAGPVQTECWGGGAVAAVNDASGTLTQTPQCGRGSRGSWISAASQAREPQGGTRQLACGPLHGAAFQGKLPPSPQIDLQKMPLGKLSKRQIQAAYSILSEVQQVGGGRHSGPARVGSGCRVREVPRPDA